MKCRHPRLVQWFYPDPIREMTCVQHRCGDCDITLSLGPSNDSDPRVQLEMRAAEIAQDLEDGGCLMSGFETFGFNEEWPKLRNGYDVQLFTMPQQAGYLARCIATTETSDE